MNDWFKWNGVRCTDYGIHVSEQPLITLASERVTFTNVPGRSGSLTTVEGNEVYDDIVLSATCFVENLNRLDQIAAYLKGSGQVEFANRPGGHYDARIVNQIPFEKIVRGNPHRSFAVNFRCKPFWYPENVPDIQLFQSFSQVNNPGSVASEPVITVFGMGDITLMVGPTIVELQNVDGSITVDSALQECYKGANSCNPQMSGEFPVLESGSNMISWSGTVARVQIQPNWRYR